VYYEIIFETGSHSIAYYESDEEAITAIGAHHDRALRGMAAQASNPQMGPAERIKRVLVYNEHPASFMASQAVPVSDITSAVDEALKTHSVGDLASVPQIAAAIRDITRPTVDSGPHESSYKMPENNELTGWDNNA
jgi:hypothetical protein